MATQPGEISRRRVLAGVAWTTPAIVLAVSVPKAAASGDPVVFDGVMVVHNFNLSDGTAGTVTGSLGFGTQWESGYPTDITTINMSYLVKVYSDESLTNLVVAYPTQTTAVAAANPASWDNISVTLTGIAAGTYYATVDVWADATGSTGTDYHANTLTQLDQSAPFTVS